MWSWDLCQNCYQASQFDPPETKFWPDPPETDRDPDLDDDQTEVRKSTLHGE
ncbi:hypothetical protein [Actinomadura hibisca]|uniref:hypothetical protein n=1 Tax=Actinomadura hibisca TaxID=68565 RepID=UPI000AF54F06|nr:hypothetical protein [Actinomadura hibisca]